MEFAADLALVTVLAARALLISALHAMPITPSTTSLRTNAMRIAHQAWETWQVNASIVSSRAKNAQRVPKSALSVRKSRASPSFTDQLASKSARPDFKSIRSSRSAKGAGQAVTNVTKKTIATASSAKVTCSCTMVSA